MRLFPHLLSGPLLERRVSRVGLLLQFMRSPLAERHALALVAHLTGLLSSPLLEHHAVGTTTASCWRPLVRQFDSEIESGGIALLGGPCPYIDRPELFLRKPLAFPITTGWRSRLKFVATAWQPREARPFRKLPKWHPSLMFVFGRAAHLQFRCQHHLYAPVKKKAMDQDQLTAAVVAGIVVLGSCVCAIVALCGWCTRRPGLYDIQEDSEV